MIREEVSRGKEPLKTLYDCAPLILTKTRALKHKARLTLKVGLYRVRQTSYGPETHPKAAITPHFGPPISSYKANLHACSAIIYRNYASLAHIGPYATLTKHQLLKRRSRGGVWAKMAQAAGGSKSGRRGAERLVRGSATLSRTRRLLQLGWTARRGRE